MLQQSQPPAGFADHSPAWAPDGSALFFVRTPVDGSQPPAIYMLCRRCAQESQKGATLVRERASAPACPPRADVGPWASGDHRLFFLHHHDDGSTQGFCWELGQREPFAVAALDRAVGQRHDEPMWSPGGTWLAYTLTGGGGSASVYVAPAGRWEAAQTPAHAGPGSRPTWSPDDSKLALLLYPDLGRGPDAPEPPDNVRLMATADTDDQGRTVWRNPRQEELSMHGRHAAEIAWSPRGDWIACAGQGSNGGVFLVDPVGQREPLEIMNPDQAQVSTNGHLAWTPDGLYLAHPGQSHGSGYELWIAEITPDHRVAGAIDVATAARHPCFATARPDPPCRCNWAAQP
jgi:Tol biopolymer transport system component